MPHLTRTSIALCTVLTLLSVWGCSVRRTTSATRLYHNITTRYNVLYNAQLAYDEAYDNWIDNIQESYTYPIPSDPIVYSLAPNKALGGSFDAAITKAQKAIQEHSLRSKPERKAGWRKDPKAVALQNKSEYNPALHHAWQLLGQAHFYNADFDQASSTFAYITKLYATEYEIHDRALLWQIRTLALTKRISEAKLLISQIDTTDVSRLHKVRDIYALALAEYHLAQHDQASALPYLEQATQQVPHLRMRMRLYYLLGQLQADKALSFRAYGQVLKLSPNPALDFASRLRRTELSPKSTASIVRDLRQMAQKRRYQGQLDQIHYTIGRLLLQAGDTLNATKAFITAIDTSRTKRDDYALSQIALGRIHLARHEWIKAQGAYSGARTALSAQHPEYASTNAISLGLDSLLPYARIVHDGDSLIRLARMPENERNKIIDGVIDSLRQQQVNAEKLRYRDSLARINQTTGLGSPTHTTIVSIPTTNKNFYFYNPQLLEQGRRAFRQRWGNRRLADHWRRASQRTLSTPTIAIPTDTDDGTSNQAQDPSKSTLEATSNPLDRAYYLAQLPLSENEISTQNEQIEEALSQMGRILHEQLERLDDAANVWQSQLDRYPQGTHYASTLYALYMMRSRLGQKELAELLRLKYIQKYAGTPLAKELADPMYIDKLRLREREENTLYASAYHAFVSNQPQVIKQALVRMRQEYPTSPLLARLAFMDAFDHVRRGDSKAFTAQLNEIALMSSATNEVKSLAHEILQGLSQGRKPISNYSSIDSWFNNTYAIAQNTANETITFSTLSGDDTALILVMPKDQLTIQQLLFALSAYNFTEFTQAPINLHEIPTQHYHTIIISGIISNGQRQAYQTGLRSWANGICSTAYILPISIENSRLILKDHDVVSYIHYWERNTSSKEQNLSPTYQSIPPKVESNTIQLIPNSTDTIPSESHTHNAEEIPQETSLQHQGISYEEIERKASDRVEQETKSRKEQIRQREEERKRKLREREERLKARERAQRKRLRMREATRIRKRSE